MAATRLLWRRLACGRRQRPKIGARNESFRPKKGLSYGRMRGGSDGNNVSLEQQDRGRFTLPCSLERETFPACLENGRVIQ